MDLSNYDFDDLDSNVESAPRIEPGVYDLHFAGYQELTGKNNWRGLKIIFMIGDTNRQVSHAFTLEHDNEDNIRRGRSSLKKMATAMGVTKIENADSFINKTVRAPVEYDKEDKYLQINENFGKNWEPVKEKASKPAPVEKKVELQDDEIPF